MKILIADSGSTKTDWALVDEQGNVKVTCKTQGISPIHQSDAEILDVLCKELVLSEQHLQ
jgi:glucosamine kinase